MYAISLGGKVVYSFNGIFTPRTRDIIACYHVFLYSQTHRDSRHVGRQVVTCGNVYAKLYKHEKEDMRGNGKWVVGEEEDRPPMLNTRKLNTFAQLLSLHRLLPPWTSPFMTQIQEGRLGLDVKSESIELRIGPKYQQGMIHPRGVS